MVVLIWISARSATQRRHAARVPVHIPIRGPRHHELGMRTRLARL